MVTVYGHQMSTKEAAELAIDLVDDLGPSPMTLRGEFPFDHLGKIMKEWFPSDPATRFSVKDAVYLTQTGQRLN